MDLADARRNLQAKNDKLGILSATLGVVYGDLEEADLLLCIITLLVGLVMLSKDLVVLLTSHAML